MEFCGGQTHSLVKNGILELLPPSLKLAHGPGCPVCVTPVSKIDLAITLAMKNEVVLCSFGDMLRVPGSEKSLLEARAEGAAVRFFYSPMEAVTLARDNPDTEVVFFGVGFETTAPAVALSLQYAKKLGLKNYSVLSAHVLVPPAISAVIEDESSKVDGFLGAGHVCSVMGLSVYKKLVKKYQKPMVVTGFEPVDLLQGILMTVKQLEENRMDIENQYKRVVPFDGNPEARQMIDAVFEVSDRYWRGIGAIPESGLKIRKELESFDAEVRFGLVEEKKEDFSECMAGEILKGIKKPAQCPHFGKKCTPSTPVGAPMVSGEGACAAYFHFAQYNEL